MIILKHFICSLYEYQKKNIRTVYIIFLILFILISFLFISPNPKSVRSAYHSSQLQKNTVKNESSERTDYCDTDGKITIAADLGYATAVVIKTENGTIEKYYDDQGKPISRYLGYYAVMRDFDDRRNIIRTTYLDAEEKPMIMGNGYTIEERKYNERGQVTLVRYFDANGFPVCSLSDGFGKKYEYDENGRICRIIYIDAYDAPMKTERGYASIINNYYISEGSENGRIESEFYFDESGNPVSLSLGQYGVHKEYDDYGREIVWTYLDREGRPMVTNKGYTTIIRTFRADNSVASECYFDLEGNPFSLSEGQYGITWENGKTTYLNESGKSIFNIKNLLYNQSYLVIIFALIIILLSAIIERRMNIILLTVYVCAIIYMTLMYRENTGVKTNFSLFWSYRQLFFDSEIRADVLKNIWLFIPLGSILFQLYKKPRILLVPIAFSAFIEAFQYFSGTGLCELDDVISNSLGGFIGFGTGILLLDMVRIWGDQRSKTSESKRIMGKE